MRKSNKDRSVRRGYGFYFSTMENPVLMDKLIQYQDYSGWEFGKMINTLLEEAVDRRLALMRKVWDMRIEDYEDPKVDPPEEDLDPPAVSGIDV